MILLKTQQEGYDKSHLIQCMASATTILSLYDLFRRTFGDAHVVLSVAYSIYTAASIFLLEIQALKYAAPGTLDKLKFCILAMERVKVSNPVIATGLSLVYQELDKLHINLNISQCGPEKQYYQPQPQPHHQYQAAPSDSHQSQSPAASIDPSRHVSPGHQHPHQSTEVAMGTQPGAAATSTSASLMQGYNTLQQPVPGFDLSRMGDMPQMAPTHLIGGMPNAAIIGGDPGKYEITPDVFEAFSYAQPMTTNMAPSSDANWTQ